MLHHKQNLGIFPNWYKFWNASCLVKTSVSWFSHSPSLQRENCYSDNPSTDLPRAGAGRAGASPCRKITSLKTSRVFNVTYGMCYTTRQLKSVVLNHQAGALEKCSLHLNPEGLNKLVLLRKGWSEESIRRDIINSHQCLECCLEKGLEKLEALLFFSFKNISALYHVTVFSLFPYVASLLLGCWYIWKLMGCWVWKRGGWGKKKKGNREQKFRGRFRNPNPVLRLFAQLLFTATLLARTNLNSLQNKMTGRWKDNICLNISDQPLSWLSQYEESLL